MSLLVIGIGITIDSIWVVGMVLPAITLTHYLIILKKRSTLRGNLEMNIVAIRAKCGDGYERHAPAALPPKS